MNTTAQRLVALAHEMRRTILELDASLEEGDFDMAGDHALTLEELAHEFQAEAS